MIRFNCECGRLLQARDENAGQKARCPSCDRVMDVPAERLEERPRPDAVREGPEPEERVSRRASRRRDDDYDDYEDDRDSRRGRRRALDGGEATSGKATASLVLGLVSWCLPVLPAIPGLILGVMGLREIERSRGRLGGKGLAIAGIVLSSLSGVLYLIGLVALGLLMPAVSKVREAASRMEDSNNLKQIGLAMHNFHDVNNGLPAAAAFQTKDGRPGLSWRVALLPYLGEEFLYRQFKLDEPWDSPHNLALLTRMPPVYRMPDQAEDGTGNTHYQVLVGSSTLFEIRKDRAAAPPGQPQSGWGLAQVQDGLANTILATTARDAVPWTKPDDMPFDPNGPLPALGTAASGFNALFADGSVRQVRRDTPEETLRALITRTGGEVVPWP